MTRYRAVRVHHEPHRCLQADGSYKDSFRSPAKARRAIRDHHGTATRPLRPYQCPRCSLWHLTGQPQRGGES